MKLIKQESDPRIGTAGLIIFDGSCGACSTFIGRRHRFFERYGFKVAPLQEGWISEITSLDESTLLQSIHLLTPDGEVLRGVDFFRNVAGKVWWLKPINLLLGVALFRRIFTNLYDFVAKRRNRISRVCRLESNASYRSVQR